LRLVVVEVLGAALQTTSLQKLWSEEVEAVFELHHAAVRSRSDGWLTSTQVR
jgi:hypothetical protein